VVTFYCTAAIVWIVCCVCVFLLGLSCYLCILQLAAIIPSNNPQVITLNLLLFDCTYCQSFWTRFECFCCLKCMWWRKECVPRDSCKARGTTTTTIMMTTRPLKPIEHHHQTRIHATIVVSQACLMNSTVSKQRFSSLFTNLLYVSFCLYMPRYPSNLSTCNTSIKP
jgi:hypothetical protein